MVYLLVVHNVPPKYVEVVYRTLEEVAHPNLNAQIEQETVISTLEDTPGAKATFCLHLRKDGTLRLGWLFSHDVEWFEEAGHEVLQMLYFPELLRAWGVEQGRD